MRKELKVGIFAVLVLIVGWGVVRYLKGSSVFSKTNTYYAYYEQVSGLQPASYVVLYGVKVGSVTNITLDENPSKGVEVEFTVDKRYKIPVDSKAKIFSDGIMGGKAIDIPPKELELLYFLASNYNRVFTRDQLLDKVWGFDYLGDSRTVDVHVKRLREKLKNVSEKWALKTVWGVGYKFEVK